MIMTKTLFALLFAGTLMVPHVTPAMGNEGTVMPDSARSGQASGEWPREVRLPPIPHLENTPWLMSGSSLKGPKVDMLFGPKLDTLGPFLVQPTIPATRFSSRAQPTPIIE
jgi:hypothetical protein